MYNTYILVAYIIWIALASIVAFFLYKKDKKMAQSGGGPVRIKEKTLLSIACMGGAIGALIGRIVCHHKTDKVYFSMVINLSLLLQAAGLVVLLLLAL